MIPTCDGCGQCCTNQPTPPFMPDEFEKLPKELQLPIDTYLTSDDFDDDAPCIWLDQQTRKCKHYEHRPEVCQNYPVASKACHIERVAVGLTVEGWPVVPDENDP